MVSIDVLHIDLGSILSLLSDITYPITKSDLVSEAESRGASEEILNTLKEITDKTYESVDDLKDSIMELKESKGDSEGDSKQKNQ